MMNLITLGTLALFLGLPLQASIANIYYAQTAAGSGNGADCADAYAYNDATNGFSVAGKWGSGSTQIGPGTTAHICGTITLAANATGFTFKGSGSVGNPVTLLFEANAILQSPYFASSEGATAAGGITLGHNFSYLVVNGGTNGVLQNTANGSALTYGNPSTGVSGFNCFNCIVENLTISNLYVNVQGTGTLGDNSVVRAIDFNGSNWTIQNNTIHDCGWCIFDSYQNGDTNVTISGNNIYNFGHANAYATSSANTCSNPCYILSGNQIHDAANWSAPGCPFHQDGLHVFGTAGSAISGIYASNNYFYGDWGTCPTGWVFIEGQGSSTPSNLSNSYWWNNVGIVQTTGQIVNTNGWFNVSSGISGVTQFFNNTILGPNNSDNTSCFQIQNAASLTFENNAISQCGDPISVTSSTISTVDYNFYGTVCGNGGNCFVLNGSFKGSFSSWKTGCSCDSHSIQNSTPLLSASGAPSAGSPVISAGINLVSAATNNLASLASGTTEGGSIAALGRPTVAAWDIGAYVYNPGPAAPTALSITVQ